VDDRSAEAVELGAAECLQLLASCDIGRIAVVHEGYPVVFPVNYRLVRIDGNPAIALRTRPGNTIDHVDERVGFEIDGVDAARDGGWSVLVRGHLLAVDEAEQLDSHPLLSGERDAWRIVTPTLVTGRRVATIEDRWPFLPSGYL
jgi:uncharacterized protein